jgi:hypothetical protein
MHRTSYLKATLLAALVLFIGSADASRDGSGTYTLPAGNPVTSGTVISSSWANTTLQDIADGVSASIAKDGQTVPTANLPMGGYKHTGIADGTARNNYESVGQAQDFSIQTLGSVAGTNTITGALSPSISSYATGMLIGFTPANTISGATTIAVNGLAARSIIKWDGDALAAGDIVSGVPALLQATSSAFLLLNPQTYDATKLVGNLGAISATSLTASGAVSAASVSTTASGGGSASAIQATAAQPSLGLKNSGGATDGKQWDVTSPTSTTLCVRTLNDANSAAKNVLCATRSGNTITQVDIGNSTDKPTVTVNGFTYQRVIRANVTGSAGGCTITSGSSSAFTACTRITTGQYQLTYSGWASFSPICVSSGTSIPIGVSNDGPSTTTLNVYVFNTTTGASADNSFHTVCVGDGG